jgi:hypothetical protein
MASNDPAQMLALPHAPVGVIRKQHDRWARKQTADHRGGHQRSWRAVRQALQVRILAERKNATYQLKQRQMVRRMDRQKSPNSDAEWRWRRLR